MKRYWEYMKDYQELTDSAKADDFIAVPEVWIGFKFLEDNGIEMPWELVAMDRIFDGLTPSEACLFRRAILSTFNAAK